MKMKSWSLKKKKKERKIGSKTLNHYAYSGTLTSNGTLQLCLLGKEESLLVRACVCVRRSERVLQSVSNRHSLLPFCIEYALQRNETWETQLSFLSSDPLSLTEQSCELLGDFCSAWTTNFHMVWPLDEPTTSSDGQSQKDPWGPLGHGICVSKAAPS